MANCVQCGRKLPPFSFKKICQWCVQHEAAKRGEVDGSDDVEQQVMPAPWVRRESSLSLTKVLFGANVAVFVAMVIASSNSVSFLDPLKDFSPQISIHFGANWGPLTLSGDWWRLLTYMFLHGSLMHIGFNMWCLWDLGALCESLYGRWTFGAIYLITGVAGGIASVGWNPEVWSVGASGAIFGLVGALIASFYLGEFSFGGLAIRNTLRSLVFFVGFNIIVGFTMPGIDNACHFGGLVSGLILGALIARLAPFTETAWQRLSVLAVVAIAVAAGGFGVERWRGASFRIERALFSLNQNGPDHGIPQFQTTIRQHPDSAEAHFELAKAYFREQDFPHAEAEFKRVLELQPQIVAARFDLGMVYLNEKQFDNAAAAFKGVLAQDANSGRAHYGMGLVLAETGKPRESIGEFKAAIQQGLEVPGLYYDMGRSYLQLKMYDEAIAAFQGELDKNGDDPDLEGALAEAYQGKGMTKEAQESHGKAERLRSQQH